MAQWMVATSVEHLADLQVVEKDDWKVALMEHGLVEQWDSAWVVRLALGLDAWSVPQMAETLAWKKVVKTENLSELKLVSRLGHRWVEKMAIGKAGR
jgi:hypothetical protein